MAGLNRCELVTGSSTVQWENVPNVAVLSSVLASQLATSGSKIATCRPPNIGLP